VTVYIDQRKKGMFTIFDDVCRLNLPEGTSACCKVKLENRRLYLGLEELSAVAERSNFSGEGEQMYVK